MHVLRLSGQRHASVPAAVEGLLAVQAENYSQASWAVATRTSGITQPEFQQLFDEGVILRTHVLRPTWHFVRPIDIRWLVEVTAPRITRLFVKLREALGLDDATLESSSAAIVDALADGHLTREALGARLCDAGLAAEGQRLGVMLAHAELSALICSGVMQGKDHTRTRWSTNGRPTRVGSIGTRRWRRSPCGTSAATGPRPSATSRTGRR